MSLPRGDWMPGTGPRQALARTLQSTHVEYWKSFYRVDHTVGFEWFATWPSTRRLRLPFGIRPTVASVLAGWIATSSQVKLGTLGEEHKLASLDRLGGEIVPDYEHPEARVWRAGRQYNRMGVDVFLRMVRSPLTQRNTRLGWRPDGTEIDLTTKSATA